MRNRKRNIIGFVFSLFLHLFIVWLFFLSFAKIKYIPPSVSKEPTKITLNLSQFTPPVSRAIHTSEPAKISQTKQRLKKHIVKQTYMNVIKKNSMITTVQTSPKKSIQKKTKRHVSKKQPDKKPFHVQKHSKLANALLHAGKNLKPHKKTLNHMSRMIAQLYGKTFYTFTATQQQFIKNHLSEIYRITQNTLYINGYPDVAVHTHQQGVNIVSFYLHPNGSISDLRLLKPMGYESLDKNTIAVIQIAYKDYPRPKTKTKIVFYVKYKLY